MNIELRHPVRAAKAQARLAIVDCDIHPKNSLEDLRPHLSNRWWDYLQTYGRRQRHGFVNGYPFPKMTPIASRRDAWPPTGGGPGSDLAFMQEQHLDHYGIEFGVLNPLAPSGQGDQNSDFSAALAYANNEAQLARWTRPDKRLRASVIVPYEDARSLGARNPPPRRRHEFRPGADAEPHRRGPWAASATGRSSKPPSKPACRSASTRSATAAGR